MVQEQVAGRGSDVLPANVGGHLPAVRDPVPAAQHAAPRHHLVAAAGAARPVLHLVQLDPAHGVAARPAARHVHHGPVQGHRSVAVAAAVNPAVLHAGRGVPDRQNGERKHY